MTNMTKNGLTNNFYQFSGGFRGGSRGSLEPPSGPTLFRFHGEFQKILCEIRQTNPPFLHLNPLFRNPGSAPAVSHLENMIFQVHSILNKLAIQGDLEKNQFYFVTK